MLKKIIFAVCFLPAVAYGQSLTGLNGDCMIGGEQALTSGLPSTATQQIGTTNVNAGAGVQASFPSCLVSVYLTGTTNKAAIFTNNNPVPTPSANPFTANVDGSWTLFAGGACYDIVMSSGISPLMPYSRTLTDVCLGGAGGTPGGTVGGSGTPPALAAWIQPTVLGNASIIDGSPPQTPNGLSFMAGAGFSIKCNDNPTGTILNHLVQIDPANGCATLNTSTTSIFGVAGPGAGNVGNVQVATNFSFPIVFDNQTVLRDWAIAGTPGDIAHDAGATRPTNGVQILGPITSVNSGAGTLATVDLNTGDTNGSGTSSGIVLSCATAGAVAYYAATGNTVSCDPSLKTDGAGNETGTSLTLTGTGAGFINFTQGTAPSLANANSVYFAAPTSVSSSFLTLLPASAPASSGCLQGTTSGGVVTMQWTGSGCGSSSSTGTVTSVGLTVNSTSPSGIFTVTGSPVTTSGTLNFNLAGTSGGVPYFSSATVLSSSAALTVNLPVIGGGAGAAPTVGTVTGSTTKFATSTGALTSGHVATWDGSGNIVDGGAAPGTGTVSSVAQTFTGGLISVAGSPITTSGTLALTVAGTSGGIPYFSTGSAWASSATLTAHGVVIGGGAATSPTSTSAGTSGQCLTSNGASSDPTFQACPGGTSTATVNVNFDKCVPAQTVNAGNSFFTVNAFGNADLGIWQFVTGVNGDVFCYLRVPHNLSGTTGSIILDLASADTTNAHTAVFKTCDVISVGQNLNISTLNCAATQNYSSTTTAFSNTELTFAVQATLAADQYLVVKIDQASGGSANQNVQMPPPMLQIVETF